MDFLEKYNIYINDKDLLETALTHTSFSNENKNATNYERLEFLGDAILQLIISEYFYRNTILKEGDMTKQRASYVCESALNFYAEKIEIKKYVKVGHGQQSNINDTILADIFEAIIGAIYLDQGFDTAKDFIYKVVVPEIILETRFFDDYKTLLQELVQTSKKSISYNLVTEEGESHDKTFTVDVIIENKVYGRGIGKSKKEAEQKAAKDAYSKSVK